ncbi:MAG: hypothetical protein AB1421_07835 [Pseudomonadota bacterium]
MHPGNRLFLYVLTALVIPGLSFFMALGLTLAAALLALWMQRPAWRLLWRARWLFAVLVLGYGYGVPGDPMLGVWQDSLPTWQGMQTGLAQALNLMSILLWLDVLVLSLPLPRLLGGLDALLAPMARLGMPARQFALRLALTLKVLEVLEQHRRTRPRESAGRGRDRLALLFTPVDVGWVPEKVGLETLPYQGRDRWLLAGLVLLTVGFAGWGVLHG